MRRAGGGPVGSDLEAIVREAAWALAHLEAERLEELAVTSRGLNCDECRNALADDGRDGEARFALAVLGRMVELTRTSLQVLRRIRARGIEYGCAQGRES